MFNWLKKREDLLKEILDHTPVFIFTKDGMYQARIRKRKTNKVKIYEYKHENLEELLKIIHKKHYK